jgi:pyruvate/2-oxoglutarate dehydrogenase complex dihydrolipoamide acyltransferase (E2) component
MPFTIIDARAETSLRRVIAERLGSSYREAIHVAIRRDASMTRVLSMLDALRSSQPHARVGLLDVIMAAVGTGLRDHPAFNSIFLDREHRLVREVNVGFAVEAPYGLMVPVVKDVGAKSLTDLAQHRRRLTASVIDRQHSMHDLSEGTFTVSNLGALGVDSVDPIINPPQTAILGIGRIREAVRCKQEREFAVDRILTLSLVFDHRVHDGAGAARFLDSIVRELEQPEGPA